MFRRKKKLNSNRLYVYVIHVLIIMVTKAVTEGPELIMNFKAGNKRDKDRQRETQTY